MNNPVNPNDAAANPLMPKLGSLYDFKPDAKAIEASVGQVTIPEVQQTKARAINLENKNG